jgi:esterase/lipase superfamily enzyme
MKEDIMTGRKAPAAAILAALSLASSATFATAAQAETIYLKCYNTDYQKDDLHTIDVANSTVDGNAATITPILFHWVRTAENGSIMTYNIDRTTGTLTLQGMIPGVGETGVVTESCTAGSAPATKF